MAKPPDTLQSNIQKDIEALERLGFFGKRAVFLQFD
jgi:hypothetical protein